VDKMFPSALDYNPNIPLSPDTATWEGAILLTQEIMAACRRHNPDWAMSFECNWDRMISYGAATWWVGNQLVTRKVFPENAETLAISQAYDYLGINNAVRDGHIAMVVPMCFARGLEWEPEHGLADYVRDVKRVRDRLADAVFLGEALGATGVALPGGDQDGLQHNVWRSRTDGRRVCILTNARMEERRVTFGGFDQAAGVRARLYTPGKPSRFIFAPADVVVPGERMVFIEELGGEG
jgi:hypothetical protein